MEIRNISICICCCIHFDWISIILNISWYLCCNDSITLFSNCSSIKIFVFG
ncbi:unnamed protein product [Brugia pahangi]|uniref:Uncharacterized protein n=1 Tax=Brugia pahangi TaxID=6280 RepID=A0A0N4TCE6_BRUPA|nr:unnamed protein product [Brugia pahangi]